MLFLPKKNSKKINYISYLKDMKNSECNTAIINIFNKINIVEINSFIDGIECLNNSRKEFYKNIISYRYNIIKDIYTKLVNNE